MRRGEIWTVAGGPDYTGKPRPALILQDDNFIHTESITLCLLTSEPEDGPALRIPVSPTLANGLRKESRVMTDKVTTLPRSKVTKRIGEITANEMAEVDVAVMIFLGLTR